jgi:alpha-L-arabinofuranosidase
MTMDKQPIAGQEGQNGLFASSVIDKNEGTVIIKIINTSKTDQPVSVNLKGLKGEKDVELLTLTSTEMDADNTLDNPEKIVHQKGSMKCEADKKNTVLNDNVPAMTFRLYKVKM